MSKVTRWEQVEGTRGYGAKFAALVHSGQDVGGEARLADVLAPRHATILDAGSGMGRVGAQLRLNGHNAVGVDLDADLLDQSRSTYPDFPVAEARLDELDADLLQAAGLPTSYDLIVCVGNVMILLAPGTERDVLARLHSVLASDGRMLVGFHTNATPPKSRVYLADEFAADAVAMGFDVESRFASYDLLPFSGDGDYVVHVLRKQGAPEPDKNRWGLPLRNAPSESTR